MELTEVKAQFEEALKPLHTKLADLAGDLEKEKKSFGTERTETKQKVDQVLTEIGEVKGRVGEIEKKITSRADGAGEVEAKTAGEVFTLSAELKAAGERGSGFRGTIGMKIPKEVWKKTAIVNATPNMVQPLVAPDRIPGVVSPNDLVLRIRALLATIPTSSNVIAFTRITTKPTAAASQGAGSSPLVRENVAKPESAMAFEQVTFPVETVGHWIPASKQVLSDAPQLRGIIDSEMVYGLKKEEDRQLLKGDGNDNELFGLLDQATAYDTGLDAVGDTKIDTLRHALLQLELANHIGGVFCLNPIDWENIELKKDGENRYIYGSPSSLLGPRIWGRPVVSTAQMDEGDFLCFDNGPDVIQLFDREDVSVTLSTEHSDFFVKNMVAILVEERLCLVTKKPLGLVTGAFPASA